MWKKILSIIGIVVKAAAKICKVLFAERAYA